jgi:hypothetical protein
LSAWTTPPWLEGISIEALSDSTVIRLCSGRMVSPTLITAPIACVKSIEQMEQYVAGAKLQLDADAIEDLDQANSSF